MRLFFGLLAIGIGLSGGMAAAQTAAEREACMPDYQKYCTGVAPGGGRIFECLAKQLDQLSPACKKVVEAHAPK
ncbi:Cysteine rich repeat-containing protein [Phyllobacterium sp. YR620]|uniref:cysteine rich repeat-containing protein n=1 Tax=Phyllobacterium sp. YR620 TaxID=1881066 RepID=UPI00088E9926|nr:cysteine rich repeat-containing protein [Phyllobacterium sp. YR620]SDP91262.1 Cysteine rich repeat-containing protein [Phyllobacterium sp. YR620]